MEKVKLLIKKRKFQITALVVLLVVFFVVSALKSSTTSTSPFSKLYNDTSPVTSIQVITDPIGARVTLGSLGFSQQTPLYSEDVSAGDSTLKVELPGYFSLEKKVTLKPGIKNEFIIKLYKAPKLDLAYKGRLSSEGRLLGSSASGRPYLVSYHAGIRTIEASSGRDSYSILPNVLKDVMEVYWDVNSQKLIAVTGMTKAVKKAYIVDFTGVTDFLVQRPVLTPLSYLGTRYSWSPSNDAIAYFGDINYTTGQSKLYTQPVRNVPTERSPVGSILGSGIMNLIWLSNNNFLSVEEAENRNTLGDTIDLYLYATKDNQTWSKELISTGLVSKITASPDRSSVVYVSDNLVVAQNMLTGAKYELGSLAEFGTNIALSFYDPSTVLVTSFVENLGFEFYLIGLESKEFQKYTYELGISRGMLRETFISPERDMLVNFTSGDTYTFKL